jgi:CheY-like chemotaxis protein
MLPPLRIRARRKDLALECRVDGDVPDALVGDAHRLQQILINLVGNALKFTDQGEVELRVAKAAGDGTLQFSVRDTGIGIPREKHAFIFEAFAQADGSMHRKYGGTGLGLAISARLVALMGGRIWVESEPGRGSTFHFTANFQVQQPGSRPAAPASAELRPAVRSLRILLAEDNPVNRRLAARVLEKRGHAVALADNGREAVSAYESSTFDLVLMDVQMPEMDGLEATGCIRSRERENGTYVPILALTAHAMKGDRERCLAAGMDGYLTKPIQPRDLIRAVESFAMRDVLCEAGALFDHGGSGRG